MLVLDGMRLTQNVIDYLTQLRCAIELDRIEPGCSAAPKGWPLYRVTFPPDTEQLKRPKPRPEAPRRQRRESAEHYAERRGAWARRAYRYDIGPSRWGRLLVPFLRGAIVVVYRAAAGASPASFASRLYTEKELKE